MIERMKKLTLLMAAADGDRILLGLRDHGAVHLVTEEVIEDPETGEIRRSIQKLTKTEQALAAHKDFEAIHPGVSFDDAEVLCRTADAKITALTHLHVEKERITKEIRSLAPWGEFDPERMAELEKRGIRFSFYTASRRRFDPETATDLEAELISEVKGILYLVILSGPGESVPLEGIESHGLQEEIPPMASLGGLKQALRDVEAGIREHESLLSGLYDQKEIVDKRIAELERRLEYRIAGLSLAPEAAGALRRLTGFVPRSRRKKLIRYLESESIVTLWEEPGSDENVPVRLRNGPVAKLFEPITRIFGLPDYVEIDTTPFLAPFFAFFFGICLADFGYGAIVLLGSLVAVVAVKKKTGKMIAALGVIFGLMTILGGLFLNTVFGTEITLVPGLPEPLRRFILFEDNDAAMTFAIALGVVQVLFGYLLQIVNRIREKGFAGGLQPFGTLLLIVGVVFWGVGGLGTGFGIGPIPVGRFLASFGDPRRIGLLLAAAGIALILLFNNIQRKLWIRPLTGLWEMYGIVSGIPGDILSYIRLFALGLAGSLLGGAINQIAFMVRGTDPTVVSLVLMLLVLVGGHGINFALAALGAFVHPLRLTFVEFYKAVGFTGGGKPYKPFGGIR